ncbi:MAG: serine hydrolase, partial [Acidobacteriota bacterium]
KYLPDLELYDPYVTHELTIRDSLSHRSGLGTWAGDLVAWGSRHNRKELLRRVRYLEPAFPFRSGYGYSNIMFLAAGETIPVITGKTWDVFIQERILNGLGMTRSTPSTNQLTNMMNVAQPHTTDAGKVVVVPWRNLDNIAPAGSINSSVLDMTKWIRMQLNNGTLDGKRIVEEAILEEIRTPQNALKVTKASRQIFPSRHFVSYGLGIGVSDLYGRLVLSHTGGVDGMLSRVMMIPEEKLGLVILTNHDDHSVDTPIYLRVFEAFLGQPQKDWNSFFLERQRTQKAEQIKKEQAFDKARVSETKPTLPVDKYAGHFRNEHYGDISVVNNGPLQLKL